MTLAYRLPALFSTDSRSQDDEHSLTEIAVLRPLAHAGPEHTREALLLHRLDSPISFL